MKALQWRCSLLVASVDFHLLDSVGRLTMVEGGVGSARLLGCTTVTVGAGVAEDRMEGVDS